MKINLLIIFVFTSLLCVSQETVNPEVVQEDTSIQGQFDKIFRTSTTYKPAGTPKKYKVIDLLKYQNLKSNVLDSLSSSKKIISEKENLLQVEKNNIKSTKDLLSKTQKDLNEALIKENSISLFGIQLSKIAYNLILWSIILFLLIGLIYFIFKFFKSNVLTKEAQKNLFEVETEFETHRKKSLEREQKLRRQLQDEVNKHRNN